MFGWWRGKLTDELSEGIQNAEPDLAEGRVGPFLVRRIFQALVGSAFGLIFASLGITAAVASALLYFVAELQKNPPLAAGVVAVVFLVAFVALASLRGRRPDYPVVPNSYDVESLTISMEYASRDVATYSRKFRLKVKSSHVDGFEDSFGWTGKNVKSLDVDDPFATIAITDTKGFYTFYRVSFNQRYPRGSIIEFTVTWVLDATSAHPFVGRVVEKPYEELTFFVQIYEGGYAPTARTTVALSAQDMAGAVHGKTPFTRGGAVAWSIKRPTLGRYYELRWTGPDWK